MGKKETYIGQVLGLGSWFAGLTRVTSTGEMELHTAVSTNVKESLVDTLLKHRIDEVSCLFACPRRSKQHFS